MADWAPMANREAARMLATVFMVFPFKVDKFWFI
jgi:hypothetical protein